MASTSALSPSLPVPVPAPLPAGLTRDQLLELYYYMLLIRTPEQRLVALYRQTEVFGGRFRSLGQEGRRPDSRIPCCRKLETS